MKACGVWISGFFGSGKSSFAKNLGYVLANRTVLHEAASDLFLKQVDSQRVSEYVKYLNQGVPYEVFMFDVQVDLSVQTNAEQIAEVMYRVLLGTSTTPKTTTSPNLRSNWKRRRSWTSSMGYAGRNTTKTGGKCARAARSLPGRARFCINSIPKPIRRSVRGLIPSPTVGRLAV